MKLHADVCDLHVQMLLWSTGFPVCSSCSCKLGASCLPLDLWPSFQINLGPGSQTKAVRTSRESRESASSFHAILDWAVLLTLSNLDHLELLLWSRALGDR